MSVQTGLQRAFCFWGFYMQMRPTICIQIPARCLFLEPTGLQVRESILKKRIGSRLNGYWCVARNRDKTRANQV
jgi:hypothetical protein